MKAAGAPRGSSAAEFLIQPAGDLEHPEDQALLADRSRWFLEKGFFTKSAVVLAGPGFNLLFAWLLGLWCAALGALPEERADAA